MASLAFVAVGWGGIPQLIVKSVLLSLSDQMCFDSSLLFE